MKTVVFIIPQLLIEETECYVEKIYFFGWHFGKRKPGLRLQTDVYLIYRSQNYKQVYFSVYINSVPQTADVGLVGFGLSESAELMTFVRLGPRDRLLPDATRGNVARCCVVGDRQTDTFTVSGQTHHDINHMNQNETARKCRRRLRKDANKERPSVRQINRKTSANNIKLKM